ncbi:hypothetical protein Sjap_011978 [Stephania japonica]|uniref:Uncharacterized protein n=1 Tax=Stephania japonica TaxID=461633 RepID=A0AAP0JE52_9MAGN
MEGADEIKVGEVDCSTEKVVCTKAGIHSYPTFRSSMMEKKLLNIKMLKHYLSILHIEVIVRREIINDRHSYIVLFKEDRTYSDKDKRTAPRVLGGNHQTLVLSLCLTLLDLHPLSQTRRSFWRETESFGILSKLALQISAVIRVWTADRGRSSLAAP